MPKSSDSINQDLEDLLTARGYDITLLDSSGKEVPVAESAEVFQFHFHRDGKDYGTVTITIDGLQKLTIYYDDEISDSGSAGDSDRGIGGTSWISLVKQLKKFAQRHQLGFVLKDTDRLRTDMKRRKHQQKLEESSNNSKTKEYDGIGFDVRSDILWPASLFESTNAGESIEFNEWFDNYRNTVPSVNPNKLCILTMCVRTNNKIVVYKGPAKFISETPTHYILNNGASEHQYSKKKQIVFKNKKDLEKFILEMTLKFEGKDLGIETHSMPVAESFSYHKNLQKLEEGAVKELDADIKDKEMSDSEFKQKYNMTREEARQELSLTPKNVEEAQVQTTRRYYTGDKNAKDQTKLAQMSDYFNARDKNKTQQPTIAEGYYGNRKMSYNDDTPSTKIIIKHNKIIGETDQRFRYIESIFLETNAGERFALPTRKTNEARAFARHIAEGGEYKDDRWNHITETCDDISKLGGFVRATGKKREQFNESAQRMISEAAEQYIQLKETIKRISGSKGYNKYFESYEPRVINESDGDLAEAFKHSVIDNRIEQALPTLNKLGIKMGKINEADMFEQWADSMIDETLDPGSLRQVEDLIELLSDVIPVGPNAEVAIGELNDIIEDDELYDRLRRTAKANPDSDARPQIIAWMQEQDNENYRRALDKIEASDNESEEEKAETEKKNANDNVEPAKVTPKKKPAPAPGDGGLPPLPGGDMGGLPPLPPLPPLKEGDKALVSFKRLLGL